MSFVKNSSASKSFIDLSLLNCVHKTEADPDFEPDAMKDLRSLTGFRSTNRIMSISPEGNSVLFKKSNHLLHFYNVEDVTKCHDFLVTGISPTHEEDTIFDMAFLDQTHIVLLLQDITRMLFITKAFIDYTRKTITVCNEVKSTGIRCRKHYLTSLIYDENGPVLVSFPLSYHSKSHAEDQPTISLFHLTEFYNKNGLPTVVIQPTIADKQALYCDPFIYRNRLYLFNRFESSLLSIAISGKEKGEVRLSNTYPDPRHSKPNSKFANKCLMVLDDSLFAYCHQRLDKPNEEPQLWRLHMGSMNWTRLHLSLSHHAPSGRVSFHSVRDKSLAYLHGECGRGACNEKAHLFQLSLLQECFKPCTTVTNQAYRGEEGAEIGVGSGLASTSTADVQESSQTPRVPPTLRYASKKCSRDRAKRSSSAANIGYENIIPVADSTNSTSRASFPINQDNTKNFQSIKHWSEEMADEGGISTISEQLKLAKEMGYTDEEIMQAVGMNSAKDGSYRPFSSTNAMIDMLTRVQKLCKSPKNQVIKENEFKFERSSLIPSSSIRRATSFHSCSTPLRPSMDNFDDSSSSLQEIRYRSGAQFQLQRLLDAFEKERQNFSDESRRSVKLLEERCKLFSDNQALLNARLFEKECEIHSLNAQLNEKCILNEHLKSIKAKLDAQLVDSKEKADQIRVLTEQAAVVKRQHESELREKDKMIADIFAKLNTAEDTLKLLRDVNTKLQKELDELKQNLARNQSEMAKCNNYLDEIKKAEQLVEQIRLERDEVRSTLSKIPTCVICLDKRPQMLYMPCSHFICCETCGSRFENCPTCRQKICGKITVYQ